MARCAPSPSPTLARAHIWHMPPWHQFRPSWPPDAVRRSSRYPHPRKQCCTAVLSRGSCSYAMQERLPHAANVLSPIPTPRTVLLKVHVAAGVAEFAYRVRPLLDHTMAMKYGVLIGMGVVWVLLSSPEIVSVARTILSR